MGGNWIPVSFNPGLHARNRYGHDIYKHSQHWLVTGRFSYAYSNIKRTLLLTISMDVIINTQHF